MPAASSGHDSNDSKGMLLLESLFAGSPADLASWTLDQAKELERPGADLQNSPLFLIAGAMAKVPLQKRQKLVHDTIVGFGQLSVDRRAEAVRLAMRTNSILQQVANVSPTPTSPTSVIEAQDGWGGAESCNTAQSSSRWRSSKPLKKQVMEDDRILAERLTSIFRELNLSGMDQGELADLIQGARTEAANLAQPGKLLDVVTRLDASEREELSEALVDAHIVPDEERALLEEAVRPGGYTDMLALCLERITRLRDYAWVVAVLPAAELFFGVLLGNISCGVPLGLWLKFDSAVALAAAFTLCIACCLFLPVWEGLVADPAGAVQRWHDEAEERSFKQRLASIVPGVTASTYRRAGIGVFLSACLVVGGALWAVVGLIELVACLWLSCSVVTVIISIVFIGLRFCLVVAMTMAAFYLMDELQRHRSRAPVLGSNPIYEFRPSDAAAVASPPSRREDFI